MQVDRDSRPLGLEDRPQLVGACRLIHARFLRAWLGDMFTFRRFSVVSPHVRLVHDVAYKHNGLETGQYYDEDNFVQHIDTRRTRRKFTLCMYQKCNQRDAGKAAKPVQASAADFRSQCRPAPAAQNRCCMVARLPVPVWVRAAVKAAPRWVTSATLAYPAC